MTALEGNMIKTLLSEKNEQDQNITDMLVIVLYYLVKAAKII